MAKLYAMSLTVCFIAMFLGLYTVHVGLEIYRFNPGMAHFGVLTVVGSLLGIFAASLMFANARERAKHDDKTTRGKTVKREERRLDDETPKSSTRSQPMEDFSVIEPQCSTRDAAVQREDALHEYADTSRADSPFAVH